MKANLTGDVIASGCISRSEIWLNPVKQLQCEFGNNTGDWEIFREDSFQIKCEPADALYVALSTKSVIKKQKSGLDAHLAIAIGETTMDKSRSADQLMRLLLVRGPAV